MAEISKGANQETPESEGFKSSGGARLSDAENSQKGFGKQAEKKISGLSKLFNRNKEAE